MGIDGLFRGFAARGQDDLAVQDADIARPGRGTRPIDYRCTAEQKVEHLAELLPRPRIHSTSPACLRARLLTSSSTPPTANRVATKKASVLASLNTLELSSVRARFRSRATPK